MSDEKWLEEGGDLEQKEEEPFPYAEGGHEEMADETVEEDPVCYCIYLDFFLLYKNKLCIINKNNQVLS